MNCRSFAYALALYAIIVLAAAVGAGAARADETPDASYTLEVRLTSYQLEGVTYGCVTRAEWLCGTRAGGVACSLNLSLGASIRVASGEEFFCNDRGRLGDQGWLDFWRRAELPRLLGTPRYGPSGYGYYAQVEVLE